tara:strand:+ start:4896 stop:5636 length:741 start_codon:yes stop_codon:yes gene_type:complete
MKKNIESISGYHSVRILLEVRPYDVLEVIFIKSEEKKYLDLINVAKKYKIEVKFLSKSKFEKLTRVVSHQGVIALAKRKPLMKEKELLNYINKIHGSKIFLTLDDIKDPRNLGACLRICDAFKISGIIIKSNNSSIVNETAKKVAAGGSEITPIIEVTNIKRTMSVLKKNNFWIYGASDGADTDVGDVSFNFPCVLIIGGEEKGIKSSLMGACDNLVKIPMYGHVESLNLSVAAGIILHTMLSQKN